MSATAILKMLAEDILFSIVDEKSVEGLRQTSAALEDELNDLLSTTPILDLHLIHGIGEATFVEPAAVDVEDDADQLIIEKPVLDPRLLHFYKENIPSADSNNAGMPFNGDTCSVPPQFAVLHISKAAARMRKYRYDHRNDAEWLNKESIRKRAMRARRKREAGGNEVVEQLSCAEKSKVEIDLVEYNRKEAERARKYRAIKRLDPVWKERDAARMRVWRAKRKADSGIRGDAFPSDTATSVSGDSTSSSSFIPLSDSMGNY